MDRRTQMEDLDVHLERECFNLAPDRWTQVYRDRILGEVTPEDGTELTVDDLGELDRYMEHQEKNFQNTLVGSHKMSGADTATDWRSAQQAEPLQWSAWQ